MSLVRPVVVPGTPPTLKYGDSSGQRVIFRGIAQYGVPEWSNTAINNNYANRVVTMDTMASWGVNLLRLRVMSNWHASRDAAGKALYVQQVKDWRDLCAERGIYLMLCDFDLTSAATGNIPWNATVQADTKAMYQDIFNALGDDPGVLYEPFNEPNQDTWATWQTYMKDMQAFFRTTLGYTGVLVIDPLDWANSSSTGAGFSDADYSALETYDAGLAGMGGQHQIVFSKHDYASNWTGHVFNGTTWQNTAVANTQTHVIFQTEFGDVNNGIEDDVWTQDACQFFARHPYTTPNFVGASAFMWNWVDGSITNSDYKTPTTYGQHVRNLFTAYNPDAFPSSVPSSPIAWFKADALALANNAAVSDWPDSSGLGLHAVQATTANQPLFKTNQINGQPAVKFDGVNDYLTVSGTDDSFATGLNMFVVMNYAALGSNPPIIGGGAVGGATLRFSGGTSWPDLISLNTAIIGTGSFGLGPGAWNVYSVDYGNVLSPAVWRHWIDGVANGSGNSSTRFTTGITSFLLGATSSLNSFLNASIAEVIIYNRVLSAIERSQVDSYLQDKYNIPIKVADYKGDSFSVLRGGAWKQTAGTCQTRISGTWQTKPVRKHGSGAWA